MFNLEQAIGEWRQQMTSGGITEPEVLNELESHLREDFTNQIEAGALAEAAFAAAAQRIGPAAALKNEFQKIGGLKAARVKGALLMLAGIPGPYQTTSMNTSYPHLEPRWATYLKAAAFLTPAIFLWIFSGFFIMPKLQQICRDAGVAQLAFKDGVLFLMQHNVAIVAAIVLPLILLEWRSAKWPRYRRATVGVGVFLLNAAVLVGITLMVIAALLAAPALLHHAK